MELPSSEIVQRALARRDLLRFTRRTFKDFEESWHHRTVCEYLNKFVDGSIRRLIILEPPRHTKTELCIRRLVPFILGRNRDAQIIMSTYAAALSEINSKDAQGVIDTPEYREIFPGTTIGGEAKSAADLWEVNEGRGRVRATGVEGGIGGFGAGYAIIDDYFKDGQVAESLAARDALWEWYVSTLYARLEKPGSILITTTRWHHDDLVGRLLKKAQDDPTADQWVVVDLPALAIARTKDPKSPNYLHRSNPEDFDPRKPGEALWPKRYDENRLRQTRLTVGPIWWAAVWQQHPLPTTGTSFKKEWFVIVEALPSDIKKWVRFWDVAGTADGGDWTAGVKIGYSESTKKYYIAHVEHGQWGSSSVDKIIMNTAKMDGVRTAQREEQEPGSAGKAVINARRVMLRGYDYKGIPSTGEKTVRWRPFAAQAEGDNVRLLRGPWNQDFIDEMGLVPNGNDDQADAASGGFNELTGKSPMQVVQLAGFN